MVAQHERERSLVEQVDLDELDAVEAVVRPGRVTDDADDLVTPLEQRLGEVRAVLPARTGDECALRAQWRPRT